MLVRLTRARRLRAGQLLALVYALCVLAPTLSFALPGSLAVSPCLTDANHVPGMMHVHAGTPAPHLHGDDKLHHGTDVQGVAHSHASTTDDAATLAAVPDPAPTKGPHGSSGQCCGLMCLTALPAALVEVVTPSVPTVCRQIAGYVAVADNGPSRLYRPPIA